MEKIKEKQDLEDVKIIPLDESMYDHSINNVHFNKVGSLCELVLDMILYKRLKEVLCKKHVYVDSDFSYRVSDGVVSSMILYFEFGNDYFKSDDKGKSDYVNALKDVLKELFETDDVSLTPNDNNMVFMWIIDDKERMLWLIDRLNALKLYTDDTFKVIEG